MARQTVVIVGDAKQLKEALAKADRQIDKFHRNQKQQAAAAGRASGAAFQAGAGGSLNSLLGAGGVLASASGPAAIAAGGAIGAAFAVGFAKKSFTAFVSVEKKWAEVTTLIQDRTRQFTDNLFGQLRDFSVRSGAAIGDAAHAAYQALSAGIKDTNLLNFLATARKGSIAGLTDLATSVDVVTTVLNAYGLAASQATWVSDALFSAVVYGKTTFGELAPAIGRVLPVARGLGISFDQVTAAIAAMTAQGLSTDIATTQLLAFLNTLSKGGTELGLFEDRAGQTFAAFIEGGGSIQEVAAVIAAAAVAMGSTTSAVFANIRAGSAATILSNDAAATSFNSTLENMTGATEKAHKKMSDITDFELNKIRARWENFKIGVGDAMLRLYDLLAPIFKSIGSVLESTFLVAFDTVMLALHIFRGDWGKAWDSVANIFIGIANVIGWSITKMWDLMVAKTQFATNLMLAPLNVLLAGINKVSEALGMIPGMDRPFGEISPITANFEKVRVGWTKIERRGAEAAVTEAFSPERIRAGELGPAKKVARPGGVIDYLAGGGEGPTEEDRRARFESLQRRFATGEISQEFYLGRLRSMMSKTAGIASEEGYQYWQEIQRTLTAAKKEEDKATGGSTGGAATPTAEKTGGGLPTIDELITELGIRVRRAEMGRDEARGHITNLFAADLTLTQRRRLEDVSTQIDRLDQADLDAAARKEADAEAAAEKLARDEEKADDEKAREARRAVAARRQREDLEFQTGRSSAAQYRQILLARISADGGASTVGGLRAEQNLQSFDAARAREAESANRKEPMLHVAIKSDDKPVRVMRAESGPIATRPRGAC